MPANLGRTAAPGGGLLVTGAGRGMGVDIAKAALAAGASGDLLTVALDVTDPEARTLLKQADAHGQLSSALAHHA